LFKRPIFIFLVAIVSIAASSVADAKPRHRAAHRAVQATIVCNDRGCADHRSSYRSSTVRHTARADQTVRTRIRVSHRHRMAGIRRAEVAYTPRQVRSEMRQARVSRARSETGIIVCNQQGCSDRVMPVETMATAARATAARAEAPRATRAVIDPNGNSTIVVGSRPAGCPHRFCGCEASRYIFGEIRPELNLAANWIRKFPRTSPAPGMAAARSGHVMILISHAGGNDWLVHDGNSGGGLTRDHVMSINRYVIVDPRSSRSAQR
jgi:hypothetical protein